MLGGLPPAPRWAWIVMALSVVAIAVMSYLVVNRPPPPGFTAPAAAEGSPAPDEAAGEPGEEVRLLVVGDGTTVPPAEGEPGWPQLLAEDIAADGPPVEVTVRAATGTGYLKTPPGEPSFVGLAEAAGPGYDVVVFFGSRDDIEAAPVVRAAAEDAFAVARAASPDADLLAIGPAWQALDAPGYIETNRDAVAAAAASAGVPFADPLVAGWLTEPERFDPVLGTPTPVGHRYLADRIRPLVEGLLPEDE